MVNNLVGAGVDAVAVTWAGDDVVMLQIAVVIGLLVLATLLLTPIVITLGDGCASNEIPLDLGGFLFFDEPLVGALAVSHGGEVAVGEGAVDE